MINNQIKNVYCDLFTKIAINNDYCKQLDFLKIYPIYIKKEVILDIWIQQYIEACLNDNQETSVLSQKINTNKWRRSIKLRNSESFLVSEKILSERRNLLNFLIIGLSRNLIDHNVNKIKIIIKLLIEYKEEAELINLIKLELSKSKSKISILPHKKDNMDVTEILTETDLRVESKNQLVNFFKIDEKKFGAELTRIFSNSFSHLFSKNRPIDFYYQQISWFLLISDLRTYYPVFVVIWII